jgi:hypothetical protein
MEGSTLYKQNRKGKRSDRERSNVLFTLGNRDKDGDVRRKLQLNAKSRDVSFHYVGI